jgi:hypothetical protein
MASERGSIFLDESEKSSGIRSIPFVMLAGGWTDFQVRRKMHKLTTGDFQMKHVGISSKIGQNLK